MRSLLDTHILVWWLENRGRLSAAQKSVIESATPSAPLWVSEISLWEIATLASLGRLRLQVPLREWLERATAPPLVRRIGITPAIAAEVVSLPDSFHRDPADRILLATARIVSARLLTQDARIIESDLVPTVS